MAELLAYNYAEVQDEDGMCVGVMSSSSVNEGPTGYGTTYVEIPVYDEEYCFKYYLNGEWYEDAEGTIPWQSSLL